MVPRRARLGPRRGELDGAVGPGSACEWSVALRVSSPMGLPSEGELCVRTTYEFLADGRPVYLSTSREPYDFTVGTHVVLPEGGPHAEAGVVNRMAAIGVTVGHAVGQPEPGQETVVEASLTGSLQAATRHVHLSDVLQRRGAACGACAAVCGYRAYLWRRMYQPATSPMRMATTKAHTVVAPWYER